MMNTNTFPKYMKEAKVIMLSKKAGSVCALEETRCIQLLTHTYKIIEKVLYRRIRNSVMFETGDY